jgi:hypothetical protein
MGLPIRNTKLQHNQPCTMTIMLLIAIVSISIIMTATSHQTVNAQDTTVTPTLGPTKTTIPTTPTQQPDQATTTPNNTSFAEEALTQADLSVLTGNVQRPNGITWHDGKLYTSCSGDWTVYQLDDTSGETVTYIYGIRNAHSLYAENGENGELTLWVPDFQSNTVNQVTRNGVRGVASHLNGPWGIAYLDQEAFVVSNLLGNNVTLISRDGESTEIISGLMSPTGLVTDSDTLYVANNGSTRRAIEWYDTPQTANLETPEASSDDNNHVLVSGLQNATGLALAGDGYLYFAYSLGTRGVVGRVDPEMCRANGGCTHDQVEIVVLTELAAPLAGLTISPEMRLYIHTMFSPDIYWVQLNESSPS